MQKLWNIILVTAILIHHDLVNHHIFDISRIVSQNPINVIFCLQDDTTQILWALGPDGSDGQLPKHVKSGARPLRLLQPVSKPESIPLNHWDVRLTNVSNYISM